MKVVKNTLIHVGIHKAGSTFIQKEILNNLENSKIITFLKKNEFSAFVDYIQLTSEQYFEIEKIEKEINELNNLDEENIVISSEGFTGRGSNIFGQGFSITAICKRLKKIFINAKVIIVLRNQKDAITSLYKDDIKYGYSISFEEWLKRRWKFNSLNYFYYSKLVSIYEEVFGKENVNIVFFEEIFGNQAPEMLLNKSNIKLKKNYKINFNRRDNESLTNIGLFVFKIVNKLSKTKLNTLTDIGINKNLKFYNFFRYNIKFLMYGFGSKKLKEPKLLIKILNEYFLKDNKDLEKILNRSLPKKYYFN